MRVEYDLLQIDKPMFGRVTFPERVVVAAIAAAQRTKTQFSQGILELCRYEEPFPWEGPNDDYRDEMIGRLSESGRLLEVIGYVHELKIVSGTLKAVGEMQDKLRWHIALDRHVAIPYMELKAENAVDVITGKVIRRVTDFSFTEVVLVHQTVTNLALKKYRERKSLLAVDNP